MTDSADAAASSFELPAGLNGTGITEAAKILSDVWKNEESRFNNLNTRGVAVLSANSLVTAFLSFFNKNNGSNMAKGGTYVALFFLVVTAGIIVFGVLRPKKRALFGSNWLTGTTSGSDPDARLPVTVDQAAVDLLAANEYGKTFVVLQERNAAKAAWLLRAYWTFFIAIAGSAVATAAFVHG